MFCSGVWSTAFPRLRCWTVKEAEVWNWINPLNFVTRIPVL
jgi:hypothetical protein